MFLWLQLSLKTVFSAYLISAIVHREGFLGLPSPAATAAAFRASLGNVVPRQSSACPALSTRPAVGRPVCWTVSCGTLQKRGGLFSNTLCGHTKKIAGQMLPKKSAWRANREENKTNPQKTAFGFIPEQFFHSSLPESIFKRFYQALFGYLNTYISLF